jgi:phosphate transport system permease protein
MEYGNFYGYVVEVREGDRVLGRGEEAWKALLHTLERVEEVKDRIRGVQNRIDDVNYTIEQLRLAEKRALYYQEEDEAAEIRAELETYRAQYDSVRSELETAVIAGRVWEVELRTVDDRTRELEVANIVRALRPNSMTTGAKLSLYLGRLWEFVSGEPREANTEGGVFPAIFGTVLMVILMSLAVVPFGVVAAIYLREYAREGFVVRSVRIAVNNLAGIPSIVYGVFGLGFFIYFLGGSIDQLFYPERLPTPTWGTGGIFWASLTLALLTVPVVIVSTEEALAAVPRELREGSLALGATKIQTVLRVVLPCATPGVLTGAILAMARGAGEVAPLMITGVVKLAPSLPVDGHFPFVHLERKFMHLGFHIYDVGFQSPNVEAAKPMVFATTLLLLLLVVALNLAAILIRNRLRRRYAVSR